MKNCKNEKIRAFIGILIVFLLYSTKRIGAGTHSGGVELLIIIVALFVTILSLYLILPYLKCLNEQTKKWKP